MAPVGFAYAEARLHARLAARMSAQDWAQLEASPGFAHALQLAGRMPVADQVHQLNSGSGAHAIEAALRQEFARHVAEIAQWCPQPWRRAVDWFGELPFLRERAFAATGEAAPEWFAREPADAQTWHDTAAHWREEWRRRTGPCHKPGDMAALLAPIMVRFLGRDTAPGNPAPDMPGQSWDALERHFVTVFRLNVAGPISVFAYLSLAALDSERLRGILVSRAIFAGAA